MSSRRLAGSQGRAHDYDEKGDPGMSQADPYLYFRNRVTGEVRRLIRGTAAGDALLHEFRKQRHPQVAHWPLWEQVAANDVRRRA